MIDFYYPLLFMSAAAAVLYLILKLLSRWTQKYFTATWHYYSHVLLYTIFFIPYFKLLSFLNPNIWETVSNKMGIRFAAPIQTIIRSSNPIIIPDASRLNTMERIRHQTSDSILHLWNVIPYVLVIGTAVYLAVILIQNIRIHRRIFSICELTGDPEMLRELSACKQKLGVTKNIPVYLSPYVGSPFLYGMLKPRIVLPAALEFTAEEYRHIFLHELTHYQRRDVWLKCLLICVNALHWFNPLAYLARRDVDQYCELSCDEKMVRSMNFSERKRYCELLLNVLWNIADQKVKVYSAFSDKKNYLERRIRMILQSDGVKRRKSIRLFSVMAALSLVIFGAAAVYAGSAYDTPLKDRDRETVQRKEEAVDRYPSQPESKYVLYRDIRKNIGPLAVELVRDSGEYSAAYDVLKPGESKSFGGYALHKGDVVSLKYEYTGDDLELYLLEYDDLSLEDGRFMESNSSYTIPEDGHYYFLLQNRSQEPIENIEVVFHFQVHS